MSPNKTKRYLEYHVQEFSDWLNRQGRERTTKEMAVHQARKDKLQITGTSSDIAKQLQELSQRISDFVDNLVNTPPKDERVVREFAKYAEGLANHLHEALSKPTAFSKKENTALNALQQKISSEINKEFTYFKSLTHPHSTQKKAPPPPVHKHRFDVTHLRKQESRFKAEQPGGQKASVHLKISPGMPGGGRGTRTRGR